MYSKWVCAPLSPLWKLCPSYLSAKAYFLLHTWMATWPIHQERRTRTHTHSQPTCTQPSMTVWCVCNIMSCAVHLEEEQANLLFSLQVKYRFLSLSFSTSLPASLSFKPALHKISNMCFIHRDVFPLQNDHGKRANHSSFIQLFLVEKQTINSPWMYSD